MVSFQLYNRGDTNDKLGFAKPDANKEQQNFIITPCQSFKLVSIEYDIDNAQIYEQIEDHYGTGQNLSSQKKKWIFSLISMP